LRLGKKAINRRTNPLGSRLPEFGRKREFAYRGAAPKYTANTKPIAKFITAKTMKSSGMRPSFEAWRSDD